MSLNPLHVYASRPESPKQGIPLFGHRRSEQYSKWGGFPVNQPEYQNQQDVYAPIIAGLIDQLEQKPLKQVVPYLEKFLKMLKLDYWSGVPPAIRVTENQKTTHGILAAICIDFLNQLPQANRMETARAQVEETLVQLSDKARNKSDILQIFPSPDVEMTYGIGLTEFHIKPLQNRLFSNIFTKHLLFIAPNGAIQIVGLPNFEEMKTMIEADTKAQAYIKDNKPIECEDKGPLSLTETLEELGKQAKTAQPPYREWFDTHTLVREVPFDYEKHIREGRLKVILDKPGADGRTVWEALPQAKSKL